MTKGVDHGAGEKASQGETQPVSFVVKTSAVCQIRALGAPQVSGSDGMAV